MEGMDNGFHRMYNVVPATLNSKIACARSGGIGQTGSGTIHWGAGRWIAFASGINVSIVDVMRRQIKETSSQSWNKKNLGLHPDINGGTGERESVDEMAITEIDVPRAVAIWKLKQEVSESGSPRTVNEDEISKKLLQEKKSVKLKMVDMQEKASTPISDVTPAKDFVNIMKIDNYGNLTVAIKVAWSDPDFMDTADQCLLAVCNSIGEVTILKKRDSLDGFNAKWDVVGHICVVAKSWKEENIIPLNCCPQNEITEGIIMSPVSPPPSPPSSMYNDNAKTFAKDSDNPLSTTTSSKKRTRDNVSTRQCRSSIAKSTSKMVMDLKWFKKVGPNSVANDSQTVYHDVGFIDMPETKECRKERVLSQAILYKQEWRNMQIEDVNLDLDGAVNEHTTTKRECLNNALRLTLHCFLDMLATISLEERTSYTKSQWLSGPERHACAIAIDLVLRKLHQCGLTETLNITKDDMRVEGKAIIRKGIMMTSPSGGTMSDIDKEKSLKLFAFKLINSKALASKKIEIERNIRRLKEKPNTKSKRFAFFNSLHAKNMPKNSSQSKKGYLESTSDFTDFDLVTAMSWSSCLYTIDMNVVVILAIGQQSGNIILWLLNKPCHEETGKGLGMLQKKFRAHNSGIVSAISWGRISFQKVGKVENSDLLITSSSCGEIIVWQCRIDVAEGSTVSNTPKIQVTRIHELALMQTGISMYKSITAMSVITEMIDDELRCKIHVAASRGIDNLLFFSLNVGLDTEYNNFFCYDKSMHLRKLEKQESCYPTDDLGWATSNILYTCSGGKLKMWKIERQQTSIVSVSLEEQFSDVNNVASLSLSPSRIMVATLSKTYNVSTVKLKMACKKIKKEDRETVEGVPKYICDTANLTVQNGKILGMNELIEVLYSHGEPNAQVIKALSDQSANRFSILNQCSSQKEDIICYLQMAYVLLHIFYSVGSRQLNEQYFLTEWVGSMKRLHGQLQTLYLDYLLKRCEFNDGNQLSKTKLFQTILGRVAVVLRESNELYQIESATRSSILAAAASSMVFEESCFPFSKTPIQTTNLDKEWCQDLGCCIERCMCTFELLCIDNVLRCICCHRPYTFSTWTTENLFRRSKRRKVFSCYVCGLPLIRFPLDGAPRFIPEF